MTVDSVKINNFRNITEEHYIKFNIITNQAVIVENVTEESTSEKLIEDHTDKKKKKKKFGLFKKKDKSKEESKEDSKELQHKLELNRIETRHRNEMLAIKKQNEEFQNKFTDLMPKLHIQAQTLGVIGETELMKLFENLIDSRFKSYNLSIINLTQVDHVSDIWLIDETHNILLVF